MLRIKSKESNKNNKNFVFLVLGLFIICEASFANEPVDIWKKSENEKTENLDKALSQPKEENKIDFSKIQINENKQEIKITESKKEEESEVRFVGLYDPEEYDLDLEMWKNTDGETIKNTFIKELTIGLVFCFNGFNLCCIVKKYI